MFTGGGTESNNLAILGTLGRMDPGHILVSALEHDSVLAAANSLVARGWEVELVSCEGDGLIDPARLAGQIRKNTKMACVQLANPVLGTIQDVREIADACHNRGVSVHCDATQAFGKMPVDVTQLRADTVSVSGHKFYGPKGGGAIYVRRGLHLDPITHGEPREMGLRPGAENVPACIGLGVAASLAARCCEDAGETMTDLRNQLFNGLNSSLGTSPVLLCEDSPRLSNTLAIELPCGAKRVQRSARQLVFAAAQSDAPPDEVTRVLRAIGRTQAQIARTLCLSIGWTTSHEQVDRTIELLADACDGLAVA